MSPVFGTMRHCVLVGLMGSGKTTVGITLGARLDWPYRDSDAQIFADTGSTVRELRDRDGVDAMHALESAELLDALAGPGPMVIGAAASVIDDSACRRALTAPDVMVVWLRAGPELLAQRFASADEHRPSYGGSPDGFLARQMVERGPDLEAVSNLVIDVDALTPDEVANRIAEALGSGAP